MKHKIYLISTYLFITQIAISVIFYLTNLEVAKANFQSLQYPNYLVYFLLIAKPLGIFFILKNLLSF